jgi:hypothetical protein
MQQLINWFTLCPQYRRRFVYKMLLKPIKIYDVNTVKTVDAKAHGKRTWAHQRNAEVAALQNKIQEENNKDTWKENIRVVCSGIELLVNVLPDDGLIWPKHVAAILIY